MAFEIITMQLGPMENNTYLIADRQTGQAVAIDPSFDSENLPREAARRGWTLTAVWLTHAHFDHIAGVKTVAESADPHLPVGLHPLDLPLWQHAGGARLFGLNNIETGSDPQIAFAHGQILRLGGSKIEVRHAPGHTPGHVVFYSAEDGVTFAGDVIFFRGVGRTDLPGGDHHTLIQSIRDQILSLPAHTRLLCGHGPETTVGDETAENPFL